LSKCAPVTLQQITLTFPVRGHSFLPTDRVFGRIEKKLRKIGVILNAEEYIEIYKEVGTVKKLGIDWTIKDFKALIDGSLKRLKELLLDEPHLDSCTSQEENEPCDCNEDDGGVCI
ncbi:hypothetical protein QE152_g40632, partial [Popillia japonica]